MARSGGKTKTLQVRVDEETAHRFNLVARARRMNESELLRVTIEEMLRKSETNVDVLKAELRREFEETQAALDELAAASSKPAPVETSSARRAGAAGK